MAYEGFTTLLLQETYINIVIWLSLWKLQAAFWLPAWIWMNFGVNIYTNLNNESTQEAIITLKVWSG